MIPLLTKMAVDRKCEFEHVILLGNYELAYALGKLSKYYNLPQKESFQNIGELKEEVLSKIGGAVDDIKIERLIRVVREMDSFSEEMDEQIYEVYSLGFE